MNTNIEFETMTSSSDGNYLIDNILEFYPAEKLLLNRLTQQHVLLHSTATQCLVLLIQKHNELVTQEQLLRFAWGDKHREVTHNAFYQCILNLRKNFVKLGIEKNIVTTIARKGLIINNDVIIDNITTSSHYNLILKGINGNSNDIDDVLPSEMLKMLPGKEKSNYNNAYKTCSILLVTTFIILFILGNRPDTRTIHSMPDYTILNAPDKKCNYYLNSDYINNYSNQESKVGRFIKNNPDLCSNNKHIYITTYENLKSMSALICNQRIGSTSRNLCYSIYYLDNH